MAPQNDAQEVQVWSSLDTYRTNSPDTSNIIIRLTDPVKPKLEIK